MFRDEEGRFGALTGSRAMMGLLPVEEVGRMRAVDGTMLADALRGAGLNPEAVPLARRDPGELAAFVELHIEQGSVLEKSGCTIGIVSAIAGQARLSVRFLGSPDHAGTTPMDMRRDALAAAARFCDRFRDLIIAGGEGVARGTVGIVRVNPNQGNVIPSEVRLGLEIRDISADRLERLRSAAAALAEAVAGELNVEASVRTVYQSSPVPMSPSIQAALAEAADELGAKAMTLPSGANHDAGILGTLIPAGMLFVPSAGGRSHCPEEHTDWHQVETAARALEAAVRALADRICKGERVGR